MNGSGDTRSGSYEDVDGSYPRHSSRRSSQNRGGYEASRSLSYSRRITKASWMSSSLLRQTYTTFRKIFIYFFISLHYLLFNTSCTGYQGSQEQEVKFQDQFFLVKFRTISGHFCRFHEAQDTENARFSVLTNLNQTSRSVLQS